MVTLQLCHTIGAESQLQTGGPKVRNTTATLTNDATTRYESATAVAWRGNAGAVPGGDVWSRYNCVIPLELKASYKLEARRSETQQQH